MTRRDLCHLTGKRAGKLSYSESPTAWQHLAAAVEDLGESDLPKFKHLLQAIRQATIHAKQSTQTDNEQIPSIRYDLRLVKEKDGTLHWED